MKDYIQPLVRTLSVNGYNWNKNRFCVPQLYVSLLEMTCDTRVWSIIKCMHNLYFIIALIYQEEIPGNQPSMTCVCAVQWVPKYTPLSFFSACSKNNIVWDGADTTAVVVSLYRDIEIWVNITDSDHPSMYLIMKWRVSNHEWGDPILYTICSSLTTMRKYQTNSIPWHVFVQFII